MILFPYLFLGWVLSPTRVSNILPTVNILTGQGSVALPAVNIRIPSQISIPRFVNFSNALPKVVFYGMSTTYGSAVLPIGRGHLIQLQEQSSMSEVILI